MPGAPPVSLAASMNSKFTSAIGVNPVCRLQPERFTAFELEFKVSSPLTLDLGSSFVREFVFAFVFSLFSALAFAVAFEFALALEFINSLAVAVFLAFVFE